MRKINLVTGVVASLLTLTSVGLAQERADTQDKISPSKSAGVQEAIKFQRAKDRADARQAKLEQRHPSVFYSNADRSMDESNDGNHVTDPGPAPKKKDWK